MAQQTAVEWLLENLPKSAKIKLTDEGIKEYLKIREQAKAMEKEQIKQAHYHNRCINNKTYECTKKAIEDAEIYYNETYNK